MRKEVLVRLERCLGCRSCELACAVAHSASHSLIGAAQEVHRPRRRVHVEQSVDRIVPLSCRHCEEPPCVNACISGAMHVTPDRLVTNVGAEQKCIGCWMCVMTCPYGLVERDAQRRVAIKCDRQCLDDQGLPACVRACPTKALLFASVEEFDKIRRQEFVAREIAAHV